MGNGFIETIGVPRTRKELKWVDVVENVRRGIKIRLLPARNILSFKWVRMEKSEKSDVDQGNALVGIEIKNYLYDSATIASAVRIADMTKEGTTSSIRDVHKRYREREYYPYFKTMQTRWSDNDQYGIS